MRPAPLKETQKNNLEAELVVIKNEIEEKTKLLSELYEKVQDCNFLFDHLRSQKEALEKHRIETEETLAQEKQEWALQISVTEKLYENKKEVLVALQEEIKEGNRELARLNHQCLIANDEMENKAKSLRDIDSQVATLSALIPELTKVKQQYDFYLGKLDEVQVNIVDRLAVSEAVIEQNTKQLEEIKAQCASKTQEMNDAEYKLKAYTDNLYSNMNDYAVVRERLNIRWKEVYPELKLPLE